MTKEQGRALYLWIDDDDLPPEVVEHFKHGDEPERSLFLLAYWWGPLIRTKSRRSARI